jgi:signal transduction histidine kinase
LFRIVQECLTNVHRHSGSPSATIDIKRLADTISLEVKDEGRGIPHEVGTSQGVGPRSGVGIMGMRERLRDLGGRLEIDSAGTGTGTRVRAVLPLGESPASIS